VIEPRRSEAVAQALRHRLVVAEDDARQHSATLARRAARQRLLDPLAQVVGQGTETAARSDRAPPIGPKDNVDALAAQPRSLVEPVVRAARLLHGHDRRYKRALRRRAAARQLEQRGLLDNTRAEPARDHGHTHAVATPPCRCGDLEHRAFRGADRRSEDAAVERGEPGASPPPSCTRERSREQRDSPLAVDERREPCEHEGAHPEERRR
jgi:hypothetical protein